MRCLYCFTCALLVCALIIIIVFVAVSFEVIDTNEVGLAKNTFTQKIDETFLYPNGRHFIGPFTNFIHYSTLDHTLTLQDKGGDDPAILVRANDGLQLTLEVSFQYHLNVTLESILSIYHTFGTDFKDAFIRFSREAIREVASDYKSFDYFSNREAISSDMSDHLNKIFEKYHAQVTTFQFLSFVVPESFKNENELTQEAKQKAETMEFQKQVVEIEAVTNTSKAEIDGEIIVVNSNAIAESIKYNATAESKVLEIEINGEIEAYQQFIEAYGNSDNETLFSYIWMNNVKQAPNQKMAIDLGSIDDIN